MKSILIGTVFAGLGFEGGGRTVPKNMNLFHEFGGPPHTVCPRKSTIQKEKVGSVSRDSMYGVFMNICQHCPSIATNGSSIVFHPM